MASRMVPLDRWVPLSDDDAISVYVRKDALNGPNDRIRVTFGGDGHVVEVACDGLNPGVRFRIHIGRPPVVAEPYDRVSTEEWRVAPPSDHVRVIDPDQIRRARWGNP